MNCFKFALDFMSIRDVHALMLSHTELYKDAKLDSYVSTRTGSVNEEVKRQGKILNLINTTRGRNIEFHKLLTQMVCLLGFDGEHVELGEEFGDKLLQALEMLVTHGDLSRGCKTAFCVRIAQKLRLKNLNETTATCFRCFNLSIGQNFILISDFIEAARIYLNEIQRTEVEHNLEERLALHQLVFLHKETKEILKIKQRTNAQNESKLFLRFDDVLN